MPFCVSRSFVKSEAGACKELFIKGGFDGHMKERQGLRA